MESSSQPNHYRLHHLGIGDIQLGRRPGHIPGMLPFNLYTGRHHFSVSPHGGLYHVFNRPIRCTIEHKDSGIDLSHLFAGVNENEFINRLFIYPDRPGFQLATRLSNLYGEPTAFNNWVTESDTEITLRTSDALLQTVIGFRFLYDMTALRDYEVSVV
ncbi:hypothetical protein [Chitinophaga sancti]|uniref:Uncharacterized protein n=1 Tax=Chitinophaga sancti TaxID=1004 RepID=A0A1K1RBZ1_9BACT|nr:hypothetical protein [Chitinophaga sancti]WQD65607.1 hypothetical protein U0033_14495 [Chitinophaga sancti]WQG88770.1 hypothetical protein SR876_27975 [Chitinophaga sancti]SFW69679.1 hypothetical protein SAMN05661012_03613 [Chitinophaga sancti]